MMRVLAYVCALAGLILGATGIAGHYLLSDVQIVPHLAVMLVSAGGLCVLVGFLLFSSLARRNQRIIEDAAKAYQQSNQAARHWIID